MLHCVHSYENYNLIICILHSNQCLWSYLQNDLLLLKSLMNLPELSWYAIHHAKGILLLTNEMITFFCSFNEKQKHIKERIIRECCRSNDVKRKLIYSEIPWILWSISSICISHKIIYAYQSSTYTLSIKFFLMSRSKYRHPFIIFNWYGENMVNKNILPFAIK